MVKKGKKGAEEITTMMKQLRKTPFTTLGGSKVIRIEDYQSGIAHHVLENSTTKLDIPASNVLIYYTKDGSKIAARPSGTEPKIKFYISVNTNENEQAAATLATKIAAIRTDLKLD